MLELLRKVKRTAIYTLLLVNAKYKIFKHGKDGVVFLLGTPLHGNIGDQAIALAEEKFLKEHCKKKMIEIPSQYVDLYLEKWEKVVRNSSILIHGGGFIGSLWPKEDAMIRRVISRFKDNKIVILPQTIYFDKSSNIDVDEYNRIFARCKDITICAREKYSYDVLTELKFPNAELIPDIVTYLQSTDFVLERSNDSRKILLCLRNDIEKTFNNSVLKELLDNYSEFNYTYTDTYEERTIYPFQRKKSVANKIKEFSSARIVITDRLHGMVLAALAGTPCIVFNNCNYKIGGVYKWISNNPNIVYMDQNKDIVGVFDKLLKSYRKTFDNSLTSKYFAKLESIVARL